jgi:hypothetical protein
MLREYEKEYKLENKDEHVQTWTSDMWAVLWEYWKSNKKTKIHKELDFSWATDNVSSYYSKNIFHLAGVTGNVASDKFYKGKFASTNVFAEYVKNKKLFDHVSKQNATFPYTCVIKEYVKSLNLPEPEIVNEFDLECEHPWRGTYTKTDKIYFDKPLWRSDKYIIFHNGGCWILTSAQYENEISKDSGGYASSSASEPYDKGWNI